jgi:hypothetical protein
MPRSVRLLLCCVGLFAVPLSVRVHAQTQAVCTFTMFNPPSGYPGGFWPKGINHYNTVVGGVYTANQNSSKGFIHYSGGSISLFGFPGALYTSLNRRNVYGTSVGQYSFPSQGVDTNGLILTSKSTATVDYPKALSTALNGINKWNVMVGSEIDPNLTATFGFKYTNGTFTRIRYPNSVQTTAIAINDNGVIVGGYELGSFENPWSGYILQNGTFKSLSYIPSDINNSGTIVAGNQIHYSNGTVKQVNVSGATTTFVNGINDLGTITGGAIYTDSQGNSTFKGFTAVCH